MRVLALDVGSSSARVCPYDERGRDAGEAVRRTYSATHGRDGAAELDPNDLVRACEAVLDETGGGHDALAISCLTAYVITAAFLRSAYVSTISTTGLLSSRGR